MFNLIYNIYQFVGYSLVLILLQYTLCALFGKRTTANFFTNYLLIPIAFWCLYYLPFAPIDITGSVSTRIPYYYYFASSMILSFIWALILCKGSVIGRITYIIYFYAIYKCFIFILGALYSLEGIIDKTLYRTIDMLTFIIAFAGMYLFCRLCIKHPLHAFENLSMPQRLLSLLCPVSFFFILQLADPSVNVPYNVFISTSAALLLVNIPVIYYLYVTIGEQYESKSRLERALSETASQLTEYRHTVLIEEQTRKERHEIKNTFFYIKTLLHEKKYIQLDEYLSEHIGELDVTDGGLRSGNALIDHILNTKISLARKNGIKIYTEVVIPVELQINEEYFCTILLNLLDNAIEASLKESDPDILIIINTKNNNLICCVKNRVSEDVLKNNPRLHTTKQDGQKHGLGLKIIKNTVKKASAIFDVTVENHYFIATVVVPMSNLKETGTD